LETRSPKTGNYSGNESSFLPPRVSKRVSKKPLVVSMLHEGVAGNSVRKAPLVGFPIKRSFQFPVLYRDGNYSEKQAIRGTNDNLIMHPRRPHGNVTDANISTGCDKSKFCRDTMLLSQEHKPRSLPVLTNIPDKQTNNSMANQNTRRRRKALAKSFREQRKAGKTIVPPLRKGRSLWKGARGTRRPALAA
jgi:hypothetical protein